MSFYNKRKKSTYRELEKKIIRLRKKVEKNLAFNIIPKYYINLDRSLDRKKTLEAEINKYGVENIYRFKAIDGLDINDIHQGKIDDVQYINDYPNCTKYQIAITLSHLECIRCAGEKGEFPFIILEDDIRFTLLPHWKKNIDQIITNLPEDCHVLQLTDYIGKNDKKGINKGMYCGAVAYMVTKKGYEKFITYYNDKIWEIKKNINKVPYFDGYFKKIINYYFIRPCLFFLDNNIHKSTHDNGSISIAKKHNKVIIKDY